MALKEILDKIQAQLPADAGTDIIALIADAKREASTVLADLSSANSESKSRREKLSEKDAKIAELEQQIAQATSPEAKAEIERLKKIEAKHLETIAAADAQLKTKWAEIAKVLTVDKTDKRHEKVSKIKDRFKLPQNETDELTIDEIKANLERYDLLESTGYFTAETKPVGGNPPITDIRTEFQSPSEVYNSIIK